MGHDERVRDRDMAITHAYTDQDIVSEADMQDRELRDELRGRKVTEIPDRNRRRVA